jgi:uncharacterized protein involved in exopolysaccharide biosynthesis
MTNDLIQAGEPRIERSGNHRELSDAAETRLARERSEARWQLIWDSRKFILRVTGRGLLLSVLIAFLIPTRYQSTVRLMPPDQGSGMGMAMLAAASGFGGSSASGGSTGLTSQLGPSLGSIAGDLLGMKNSSDLFVGILHSRTLQDDLIEKFNLKKEYRDRKIEDARDDLDDRTDFTTDRKSGIITIEVTDHSPKQAAAMANEYVNKLNQVVTVLNTSAAHRERVFLETRLVQVKDDLEAAEKNFGVFASKNTTIDLQSQAKAMIEAGAELEGQLIAAQTELQGLRQIYSDSNMRVRATQARVNELQRQVQKIGGSYSQGTTAPDEASQLYPSIRQLPLLGVSYADLFRDTKVEETIFEVLTKEFELSKVQEAKDTPSVKVLDAPDIPEKRHFPPRLLISVLGTLLALSAGVWFVFARARWDETDDGDKRKVIAIEAVSTIRKRLPWISSNGAAHSHDRAAAS